MAKPRTVQLTTEAGARLAGTPWDVYPRPQLRRDGWINLNGEWDFAVRPPKADPDESVRYDGRITVPYPPEAALSGVGAHFPEGSVLYYRRRFVLDEIPPGKRLLLHIGAADQSVRVRLDGRQLGSFCTPLDGPAEIPLSALRTGEHELVIAVTDDLRRKQFPYGKQTRKRGGMWYTPFSGIWQTVWLEWVPETYISGLKITPSLTGATVEVIEASVKSPRASSARPYIECEGVRFPIVDGKAVITPARPHLWTPEDPHLYEFTVKTATDEVRSYFALRTVEVKTVDGRPRICLSGKPYFLHALLDQGYWPDGICTPASPQCYEDDILAMKRLGFNTLRKHIKLEPAQFYYDCDRLGMLVMQDMVNNGHYSYLFDTVLPTIGLQKRPLWLQLRTKTTRRCFRTAMEAAVRRLYNHPCIVYWTIFNEGWGQFAPSENYEVLRKLDPTRIIDTTSGWFRGGRTDVDSRHVYFSDFVVPKSDKPVVLSEFGGFCCKIPGHSFNLDKTYAYRFFDTREAYMDALEALYRERIIPAARAGLCGAVYTQLSDVEDETNGLVTYDRRICKPDEERMRAIATCLQPPEG